MKRKAIFAIILFAACVSALPSFCAAPAGTTIDSQSQMYYEGGIIETPTIVTTVEQIWAITIEPTAASGYDIAGITHYFPHSITNIGNGSDSVSFRFITATPETWTVELIKDNDGDGSREAGDTTLDNPLLISEDGKVYFFVAVTTPTAEVNGRTGTFTLYASSEGLDGGYYSGANGTVYGGLDTLEVTDVLTVEAVKNLRIYRNTSTNQIYLAWDGANADIYFRNTTYESSMSGYTVEAYHVSSPYYCASLEAKDGKTRYFRAALAGSSAFAPQTAGKCDFAVHVGANYLSSPLVLYENDLKSMLSGQVSGEYTSLHADKVWFYDASRDTGFPYYGWDKYWLVANTGSSPPDGEWYNLWTGSPATRRIGTDEGWVLEIDSRHAATYITIVGEVSRTNRLIPLNLGLNMVGSCFPVNVPLESSNLWGSGMMGGDNSYAADRVWDRSSALPQPYVHAWLVEGVSPPVDGHWYTENHPSPVGFSPGRAYFIQVRFNHGSLFWNYTKPY